MKKQSTPEQKAAKAARRERFKAMVRQVAAMSEEERAALVNRAGAVLTCQGRALSPVNTCLLMQQMPNASLVGGFRQWLKAGRAVMKGCHGAMIWVPAGNAKCRMQNAELPEEEDAQDEKKTGVRFLIGTVFDISQTQELTVEQAARISQQPTASASPETDDMRFDPANPERVPAMVPAPVKPRKRGQQIIPCPAKADAPVAVQPQAKPIDLNSVVFPSGVGGTGDPDKGDGQVARSTPSNIIPLPAPAPAPVAVPRWRRANL